MDTQTNDAAVVDAVDREMLLSELKWFQVVVERLRAVHATDIYVLESRPARIGLLKECTPIEPLIKPGRIDIDELLSIVAPADIYKAIRAGGQTGRQEYHEFAFSVKGSGRFRVSVSTSEEGMGFAARVLPYSIPRLADLDQFGFLKGLREMLDFKLKVPSGLILHTGITGSGKSTLIASELDLIAERISGAIYTFENPIEFRYLKKKAFLRQYEIGRHLANFVDGIRMSLRNNLSCMMIGEVRTKDEIQALVDAAMRGCLVFSTMHTSSVMNTLRFLDGAGGDNKDAWRQMVAFSLKAIVSQRLIYKEKYGFILIPEVLIPDNTVRAKIASGDLAAVEQMFKGNQLREGGGVRFDEALTRLHSQGIIETREKNELAL
jgi:twitching motility protein PilT